MLDISLSPRQVKRVGEEFKDVMRVYKFIEGEYFNDKE